MDVRRQRMNRTIKFRAWDKMSKYMVDVDTIDFTNGYATEIRSKDIENKPIKRRHLFEYIVLMQYIGLTDKNGKEIYEGDLVRCLNNHVGKVYWDNSSASFEVTNYWNISDDWPSRAFIEGKPEIIGNTWENTEL